MPPGRWGPPHAHVGTVVVTGYLGVGCRCDEQVLAVGLLILLDPVLSALRVALLGLLAQTLG
eukprot:7266414-Lingulodinium_polyedra.AAC.1